MRQAKNQVSPAFLPLLSERPGWLRDPDGRDSLVVATQRGHAMGLDPDHACELSPRRADQCTHTTDEEWAVIEPHILPRATGGRSRTTHVPDVVNAVFFIAQTGCQWRMLPKDFPPFAAMQRYFYAWRNWLYISGVKLLFCRLARPRSRSLAVVAASPA